MNEPWFLGIKIHVLLNRLSYLRGTEREVMMSLHTVRFSSSEGCGLGFWIIFRSMCKKKKRARLIRPKRIQDYSIREQASFISDIFLGLHLWGISLIYLFAPFGCVPEAGAKEWKPPTWAAYFFIFPSSISRSTGFHCSKLISAPSPLSCLSPLPSANISNPHLPTLCQSGSSLPLLN